MRSNDKHRKEVKSNFDSFQQEITDIKRDFVALKIDINEDINKKLEGIDDKAAGNRQEIERIINTIEAQKRYAAELAKNLGYQMHQMVEHQNTALGDYASRFS